MRSPTSMRPPQPGSGGRARRGAFTLLELIFVITIIGILLALLLPATRRSGGAARRMNCSNHFKQIGLALHNYHQAYKQFPVAMGGTVGGGALDSNQGRLSGLAVLLPFVEQQALWEQILNPSEFGGKTFPPMGPAPWVASYEPWRNEIPIFQCPSARGEDTGFGKVSFAFCVGDMAEAIHQPKLTRGIFAGSTPTRFRDILDGTANTIAMCEIGNPLKRRIHGQYATGQPTSLLQSPASCDRLRDSDRPGFYVSEIPLGSPGRGGRWADGAAGYSLVNTILPPQGASCAIGGSEAVDGFYTAGSFHQGGCHVLMADGAVIFITESIDAGDSSRAPLSPVQVTAGQSVSPFGLWGALGTAAADDEISDTF